MIDGKFLKGCRILDVTQLIAGSGACGILADLGAEVIKVEGPDGDVLRRFGCSRGGYFSMHAAYNRGKKSICLDLKTSDGVKIFGQLAQRADVLVENFRPGVLDRLGLGERHLRPQNPTLIYASITGFGSTGPYSKQPAMDMIVQALTGMCFSQNVDGGGPPSLLRIPLVDKTTALVAVQWILAALYQKERTGQGAHLEIPMLDVAISFVWPELLNRQAYVGGGVSGSPGLSPPDWIAKTADGYIMWAAKSDQQVDALFEAMGKQGLRRDARFDCFENIKMHNRDFAAAVSDGFLERTTADWSVFLEEKGLMVAPLLEQHEVVDDRQVRHNGLIQFFEHETAGACNYCLPPGLVDGERLAIEACAAELGAHTSEILATLDYSSDDIARLKTDRVAF